MGIVVPLDGARQRLAAMEAAAIDDIRGPVHQISYDPDRSQILVTRTARSMPGRDAADCLLQLKGGILDSCRRKRVFLTGIEISTDDLVSPHVALPLFAIEVALNIEGAVVELMRASGAVSGWMTRGLSAPEPQIVRRVVSAAIADLTLDGVVHLDRLRLDMHTLLDQANLPTTEMVDFDIRMIERDRVRLP